MSDRIKHKRSSVSGKIPTIAQLEQGELGINTADGKIFLNKNGSSIEQVLITNTAAPITGSVKLSGSLQLTGSMTTTTTPTFGDTSKKIATTEFVQSAVNAAISVPNKLFNYYNFI